MKAVKPNPQVRDKTNWTLFKGTPMRQNDEHRGDYYREQVKVAERKNTEKADGG